MPTLRLLPLIVLLGASIAAAPLAGAQTRTPPTDQQLRAAVVRTLQDHHLQRGKDPQVEVANGTVTLSGQVRSFWEKEEAIKWARAVDGVTKLVSDLVITRAESDKKISEQLGSKVLNYGRYTVFDDISSLVRNGAVTLDGVVTTQEKSNDILDMASRVQGVQAVTNRIQVLPASDSDSRIRAAIAQAIFSDSDLERYSRETNPPIRIIVQRGQVTIKGFVYSALDKQRVDSLARNVQEILKYENLLQVVR